MQIQVYVYLLTGAFSSEHFNKSVCRVHRVSRCSNKGILLQPRKLRRMWTCFISPPCFSSWHSSWTSAQQRPPPVVLSRGKCCGSPRPSPLTPCHFSPMRRIWNQIPEWQLSNAFWGWNVLQRWELFFAVALLSSGALLREESAKVIWSSAQHLPCHPVSSSTGRQNRGYWHRPTRPDGANGHGFSPSRFNTEDW